MTNQPPQPSRASHEPAEPPVARRVSTTGRANRGSGYDLVVVGGGVVGASVAFRAAGHGLRTLVLDAGHAGRATDAGAGIVSPATNTRDPETWFRLATAAAAGYPRLVAELADCGVSDPGYARVGELVIAVDEDEAAQLIEEARHLATRSPEVGPIDPHDARRRFPALGHVSAALWAPDAARVDGRRLAAALVAGARHRGATVDQVEVIDVIVSAGRVTGVRTESASISAADVVVAGGAWSPTFERTLGCHLAVEPQRGQIVHLRTGRYQDVGDWPLLATVGDRYQVPWPDGRVAVGATRETGSGYDAHTTAAGVLSVLQEALRVSPGLADAAVVDVRVGLRPVTPDLLPVLGAVPGWEGIHVATGHGPTGLTLGPFTAGLIADGLAGIAVEHDLTPFRMDRPALQTTENAAGSVAP